MKMRDVLISVSLVGCLLCVTGCLPAREFTSGLISRYQQLLVKQGPQERETIPEANEPNSVGLVRPLGRSALNPMTTEPNLFKMDGTGTLKLSVSDAIQAALVNSPEIHVISYDPALAKEEIEKQMGAFDPAVFGESEFNKTDKRGTTTTDIRQADVYEFEAGLKQRNQWGTEWSASYALTNAWDDLITRDPSRRYEPVVVFKLKQPLLRDAWQQVNMANVNVARLQHKISLLTFQQKAEELATETISAYWQLVQARQDESVFKELLNSAEQTLDKVQGRRQIDATDVQVRQAIVSVNARKAYLVQAGKQVKDAQDQLIRLMSDPAVDLLDHTEIVPTSTMIESPKTLNVKDMVAVALKDNPVMQQARVRVDVTNLNVTVADRQTLPRLDLVASATSQGLSRDFQQAHDRLNHYDYNSYGVGLSMEIPIGNRVRQTDVRIKKLERLKAKTMVQNVADQVAVQVKERLRRIQSSFEQIAIQEDTVQAATAHLLALEDSESIRERLTPEYLQVKLQAQEALATAQRARMSAVVDYNVALAQLAQITGRVLKVHPISFTSSVIE